MKTTALKFLTFFLFLSGLILFHIATNQAQPPDNEKAKIQKPEQAKAEERHQLKAETKARIDSTIEEIKMKTKDQATIVKGKDGVPRFLFVKKGHLPTKYTPKLDDKDETILGAYLVDYGQAFGIKDAVKDMKLAKAGKVDKLLMRDFQLKQFYKNLPVFGANVRVLLNGNRTLKRIHGRVVPEIEISDVLPTLTAVEARGKVIEKLVTEEKIENLEPVGTPELGIFPSSLYSREGIAEPALAWRVSVQGRHFAEVVFVDAKSGKILHREPGIAKALDRKIYNANENDSLPGSLVLSEGDNITGNTDDQAADAYNITETVYDYFSLNHSRDSVDDAGGTVKVSVHYDNGDRYDGTSGCASAWYFEATDNMALCNSMATEDLIGHEYTHGVTNYTSNLGLTGEAGALNESYSDIFGTAVDADDWTIGEAIAWGPYRSLSDPPKYSQPDKVSSSLFDCSSSPDIYKNMGVPNKAAYLMATGGTFNGKTINGIGRTKMEQIEYRALTTALDSNSDFKDNYTALNIACDELAETGSDGITDADCAEVDKALKAVEMDVEPCSSASALLTKDTMEETGASAESGGGGGGGCSLTRP